MDFSARRASFLQKELSFYGCCFYMITLIIFINFSSNNFALKGKRKTINAQDVLAALEDMEFDQFVDPLKECLAGKLTLDPDIPCLCKQCRSRSVGF